VEDRCLLSGYNITDLTFPGGYQYAAGAVNNLGQVAGRGIVPGVMDNAVVWQNGSIINLDPQQLHGVSYAIDLTNPANPSDLQVVGDWATNGDVFLWVGGTMYDTGIPYSPAYAGWSLAISNSGVVAGGYHPGGDPGQSHAFVWTDANHNHLLDQGELQDLNSVIPTATISAAEDIIDASGPGDHRKVTADAYVTVAGGGQQWRAFLLTDLNDNGVFDPGEVTDLGTLRKGVETQSFAINDAGQVAGYSGSDAFVWQAPNGPFTDLFQFAKRGWLAPIPGAINHGGEVVGHVNGTGGVTRAWVQSGNGSITDLNGLIPAGSGWFLQDARDVNDSGQIVVVGQKSGSSVGACLLTRTSTPAAATTSVAHLTEVKTSALAPVEAPVQSPLPRTAAMPSITGPPGSSIVIPLTSAADQDLSLFITELIRSGKKRSGFLFQG
jgi:uncharacterized membrane protein